MSEIKTNKISPRKGTTTTITDSGDTVTVTSGANINNAGTLTINNLTNSGTLTSTGTLTTAGISGGTINNSGSGSITGLQGVIDWQTGSIKTTAFTASANEGYFCNTTSAAFTVTLPASPTAGDVIALKDYADTFDTNNLTINPNGNKIIGQDDNTTISVEGQAITLLYIDATQGWKIVDQSKAADIISPQFTVATGGTITTCGNFKIHTFTSPGTFCVSQIGDGGAGGPAIADYVVSAGGGGGGGRDGGGGGGAGGMRLSANCYSSGSPIANPTGITLSVQGYPITVGGGGTAGAKADSGSTGGTGSNSVFSTITSAGGGGGNGPCSPAGGSGGSGGGGRGGDGGSPGGSGNTPPVSPSQGNNGAPGEVNPGDNSFGGGGGGAGAAGSPGTPTQNGGDGGIGSYVPSSFGSPNGDSGPVSGAKYFSGGGGGAGRTGPGGCGGAGGGGNATPAPSPPFTSDSGATNSGGGGGGGSYNGLPGNNFRTQAGAGGSGIVIIRYKYQ